MLGARAARAGARRTAATSSARRCISCASPGCCSRCATPTRDALAPLVDAPLAAAAARGRGAASPGRRDRAVQRQRLRRVSAAAGADRSARAHHGRRSPAPAPAGFALPQHRVLRRARAATAPTSSATRAPIGPDYQPGHAHGDLLSFELSFAGRRVVTDSGVHGYDGDPLRAWCRSTHAHNTVEIDGQSQCEFWSVFRVARRARPRDVRFERARPTASASRPGTTATSGSRDARATRAASPGTRAACCS